jgi:ABC-type uncharacterized transport system substrate-binding protein
MDRDIAIPHSLYCTRRRLLQLASLGVLAPSLLCAQAHSQRIGILAARPLSSSFYAGGVVKRLEELGYRLYEYRSADGDVRRYARLARELVEAKCDLMFAIGPAQAALAFQDAQTHTPVVFLAVDYDPVEGRGIELEQAKRERYRHLCSSGGTCREAHADHA